MATPTELSVLLRLYTSKLDTPTISIADFCEYLQKYARHYIQDTPELVKYLEDTVSVVTKELDDLEAASKVFLSTDNKGKKYVFVPHFYIDRMIQRYRDLDDHPEIPFPLASEIPSGFPPAILKPVYITSDFLELMENGDRTNAYLNQLIFPDETPPAIFPGSISPEKLLVLAMAKIRLFLHKDESRDYIQKRMMVANPGKELSIKNHLVQFQTRPTESLRSLKHSGEAFLFWSFMCSFIRQDYSKKNEKTPEENSLIQSVYITEYLNNYYKNKAQQDLQRETALKNLELCFQKPPYYFDMESIMRFVDSRGVPLLGQYKNTDLETYIKEKTMDAGFDTLSFMLVFKTEQNNRYFVLKEKVYPLVLRLSNESRKIIKDVITQEWYQMLSSFRQEDAMKNQQDFELKLENVCRKSTPILHAVLNASFIALLSLENGGKNAEEPNGFRMFDHGRLLSYSELLMLNRQELLTDTRILLPFWYTVPIISAIFAFFHRPPRQRTAAAAVSRIVEKKTDKDETDNGSDAKDRKLQRKAELKKAVTIIEKKLVPADSTLAAEIKTQRDLWNRTLDPQGKVNLTEDVNSLIRDYIRRILKTLKASTFDLARVENLANTLVDTPGLVKIKNRDALLAYVELYILHLIRNVN